MKLRLFFWGAWLSLLAGKSLAGLPFDPLPPHPPIPADNPQSEAKIALGKQLFFDPRLSLPATHSCNSCHNLAAGGDDGRAVAVGVEGRKGYRNTLTLWNAAYHTVYNWDGRARTLEEQFRDHVTDPNIMGMPTGEVLARRIGRIPGYVRQFDAVFPGEGVSVATIAKAVASFERTLVTTGSPYDRYLQGDEAAISAQAKRGFETFIDEQCASCHFWVNMAGPNPGLALQQGEGFYELFPNHTGTDYEYRYHLADDLGRYNFTQREIDLRKWRVPSLRNIEITAPYFHNGRVETLDEAVRVMAKTQLRKVLSDEKVADIVAFLKTLTGQFPPITLPRLPATPAGTVLDGYDQ